MFVILPRNSGVAFGRTSEKAANLMLEDPTLSTSVTSLTTAALRGG